MKTRITELLGIQYPIIQGGMAWVAEHHLAAAVSAAGGLGLIGGANAPGEVVREEIRKARELTDKPIGVNVMLLSPHADDVARVVVEEGIKVVTTGAGNPEKYMDMWKAAGIKVIPVVASVALAKRMEKSGGVFLQAESEIAAINMVLGAASTGVRAMTSSSSPGVSLKAEGISYMAGSDLPGLIINVQRGGPGLGSIQPAQSDYNQATHAMGHGDFHILVYAPCSVQEMVDTVTLAFDKADNGLENIPLSLLFAWRQSLVHDR